MKGNVGTAFGDVLPWIGRVLGCIPTQGGPGQCPTDEIYIIYIISTQKLVDTHPPPVGNLAAQPCDSPPSFSLYREICDSFNEWW